MEETNLLDFASGGPITDRPVLIDGNPAPKLPTDPRTDRERSPERDFGVWWKDEGRDYPRWRVSWVELTGEVYAVEATAAPASRRRVRILGATEPGDRDAVERALDGWERLGEPEMELDWIRRRLGTRREERA